MVVAVRNLLDILATPTEVFTRVKEKPDWFWAFACISVLSIAMAFFTLPLSKRIAMIALEGTGTLDETQIQKAISLSERLQYIGLLAIPVLFLLRWTILASVLYFSAILLGAQELQFKKVFSVLVYAETILLLVAVINILLLHIKGVESILHPTDLQAIVGLDILMRDRRANLPLFTLLNSINVFSLWYVATLSIGVSVITNFSKLKSAVIVSSVWLLAIGFQVALAAIYARDSAELG